VDHLRELRTDADPHIVIASVPLTPNELIGDGWIEVELAIRRVWDRVASTRCRIGSGTGSAATRVSTLIDAWTTAPSMTWSNAASWLASNSCSTSLRADCRPR
jgi:hypothetical protein